MKGLLFWSPRVLALLFAAFLSIFAFAALGDGHGAGNKLVHFAMSLLPALIVVATLAVAWRWPLVGAAVFLTLGVLYVATSWGQFPLVTHLAIAAPPILVAVLFVLDWKYGTAAPGAHENRSAHLGQC